jgi:hypothetical protein
MPSPPVRDNETFESKLACGGGIGFGVGLVRGVRGCEVEGKRGGLGFEKRDGGWVFTGIGSVDAVV